MDFDKAEDTPPAESDFSFQGQPTFDTETQVPASFGEEKPADEGVTATADPPGTATSPHKVMYILIFTIFTSLIVGVIIVFVVINTVKSSQAQNTEDPYERYRRLASSLSPTPKPTVVPTAPVVIATPITVATTTPTASSSASTNEDDEIPWEIIFADKEKIETLAGNIKISTPEAYLFGPIQANSYVCVEENRNTYQYFAKQSENGIYQRVCDEVVDTTVPRFTCSPYDPDEGITITEPLLPSVCDENNKYIEPGTYEIFSKVFYNCDVEGKTPKSITESDCGDVIDVRSEDVTIN